MEALIKFSENCRQSFEVLSNTITFNNTFDLKNKTKQKHNAIFNFLGSMNALSPHSSLMVFSTITGLTEITKKTITGPGLTLLDTRVNADLMESVVPTQIFAVFVTH